MLQRLLELLYKGSVDTIIMILHIMISKDVLSL